MYTLEYMYKYIDRKPNAGERARLEVCTLWMSLAFSENESIVRWDVSSCTSSFSCAFFIRCSSLFFSSSLRSRKSCVHA